MDTQAVPDVALGQMRPVLMKFARMRLRNEVWAEDVVSETALAALQRSGSFEARSQFQTWVIGILKHKIIDMQRRLRREVSIEAQIETDELTISTARSEATEYNLAPRWTRAILSR